MGAFSRASDARRCGACGAVRVAAGNVGRAGLTSGSAWACTPVRQCSAGTRTMSERRSSVRPASATPATAVRCSLSDTASAVAGDAVPRGVGLVDLGSHRLKDLARPERVWSLVTPRPAGGDGAVADARCPSPQPPAAADAVDRSVGRGRRHRRRARRRTAGDADRRRRDRQDPPGCAGRRRHHRAVSRRGCGGSIWLPLRDGAAIGSTLLAAIGASEDADPSGPDRSPATGCRRQPALVVFDNCEHVIADAATVIDELRAACPALVVLATSREPLGLAGEVTWRVPSLSVPPRRCRCRSARRLRRRSRCSSIGPAGSGPS